MERSNEQWIDDLTRRRESALIDLRAVLLRNLRRALIDRPRVDDSSLEDFAQESLLKTLDRLDQFGGRSRFTTWATSLAIRTALTHLRSRAWRDVSLDELTGEDVAAPPPTDGAPSPAASAERRQLAELLHEAIERDLTPRQRMALLAELRGAPQVEIVRQIGGSLNALYKLTHDARKKLKRRLEAAGYTASDVAS